MTSPSVVLVGGGGVVGAQVASLLARRRPDLNLVIAGRRLDAAQAVAARHGAEAMAMDVDAPVLPAHLKGALIVGLVNDAHDRLLRLALTQGHAYLDVTRWTERLKQALLTVAAHGRPSAPVVLSSAWMAGVASLAARDAARTIAEVERVGIDILFAMADQAGPNSTAYMDRLSEPFHTMERGEWVQRSGFLDGRIADFGAGGRHRVYRFDTPDQANLPAIIGAAQVDARIGFDDGKATALLHLLVRSGVWRLLSRPMFNSARRALLYNPGPGAAHRIRIAVAGKDAAGRPCEKTVQLADPLGQSHLTALGAVLQIEHLLGADAPPAGVYLGEALLDPEQACRQLRGEGVEITAV
ncbi:saccharopine dehydrogenase NADP-binding domain-containing protein [Chromobacterium haemolyticum]|uniref:saccharopine dehydrogenase NADP-binding domain-containing protein n=1 Tax=Chromobacterium haemolyticum TaxID=394935 RepID=UPI0017466173|nr:saccharopine dehydrogenase NADP-binding domain-containing protein [Chromobacterium haemolyticum]QOD82383.1 saccharopine dehydrogenase NADP-binding domain-containing protein [Chromobacterium haemolyticum]